MSFLCIYKLKELLPKTKYCIRIIQSEMCMDIWYNNSTACVVWVTTSMSCRLDCIEIKYTCAFKTLSPGDQQWWLVSVITYM